MNLYANESLRAKLKSETIDVSYKLHGFQYVLIIIPSVILLVFNGIDYGASKQSRP